MCKNKVYNGAPQLSKVYKLKGLLSSTSNSNSNLIETKVQCNPTLLVLQDYMENRYAQENQSRNQNHNMHNNPEQLGIVVRQSKDNVYYFNPPVEEEEDEVEEGTEKPQLSDTKNNKIKKKKHIKRNDKSSPYARSRSSSSRREKTYFSEDSDDDHSSSSSSTIFSHHSDDLTDAFNETEKQNHNENENSFNNNNENSTRQFQSVLDLKSDDDDVLQLQHDSPPPLAAFAVPSSATNRTIAPQHVDPLSIPEEETQLATFNKNTKADYLLEGEKQKSKHPGTKIANKIFNKDDRQRIERAQSMNDYSEAPLHINVHESSGRCLFTSEPNSPMPMVSRQSSTMRGSDVEPVKGKILQVYFNVMPTEPLNKNTTEREPTSADRNGCYVINMKESNNMLRVRMMVNNKSKRKNIKRILFSLKLLKKIKVKQTAEVAELTTLSHLPLSGTQLHNYFQRKNLSVPEFEKNNKNQSKSKRKSKNTENSRSKRKENSSAMTSDSDDDDDDDDDEMIILAPKQFIVVDFELPVRQEMQLYRRKGNHKNSLYSNNNNNANHKLSEITRRLAVPTFQTSFTTVHSIMEVEFPGSRKSIKPHYIRENCVHFVSWVDENNNNNNKKRKLIIIIRTVIVVDLA
ncbi:hypothetical protein ADEAN_000999500 [Angomonas deanei]|uniref:Uncharacterized protein n=1 Tax=Angomonas deanei TaxID=59799 RepID=A0A7G2CTQ7_9TRYP|nr:hypothetical protein ADEAN_000999500 [Angomonas deanei]